MRILLYANAPWAGTGYGTQAQQLLRRLKADGHTLAVANNYGLSAGSFNWEDIPVLPQGLDPYSRDVLLGHAELFKADWILTLFDVWVFPREQYTDVKVASWVPIDSEPVPPGVLAWCREHLPIAMSKFGEAQLKANGVPARYAPHAVDRDIYRPRTTDARKEMGVPEDAFLVFINAANKGQPPRKAWAEMLDAFAQFARKHRDAYLLLNTDMDGTYQGVPIGPLLAAVGAPEDRVRVIPQYQYRTGRIGSEHVAALYGTSDVLLSTSMGEGFGLAVLESQACGTPVIITDFTAQPELLGAGWKVGYQRYWHQGNQAWWATPKIPEIVEALEASYEARGDAKLRERAIEFAAQYDADKVYAENWRTILSEMEAVLNPKKRPGKSNAARRRARKAA